METSLIEALTRIRERTLLIEAGRGAARLLAERVTAAPRVAAGAALAALIAAIAGNALLMQAARRPAPIVAPAAQKAAAAVQPVAAHAPPAAEPAAQGAASQASAPATTSSIAPAAEVDRPVAPQPAAPNRVEKRPAARAHDDIAALLRGAPADDGSRLVRQAQVALAKLGYPVKPGGAEDGATRRALRRFQHAHGLPETAEISPELVRQLVAAAKAQR